MNNAYVVGYSIVDALGNNPTDCFQNMLNNQDYTSKIQSLESESYKISSGLVANDVELPENFPKVLTKTQRLGMYATNEALKMSKLAASKNVSVVFSTVLNDVEELDYLYPRLSNNKRVHPYKILNRIPDMLSSHISRQYQFMGASHAVLAGCSSGIASIEYAMRIIDDYDYIVVGGADAGCFPYAIKYFNSLGALSEISKPFDDNRSGFVMGEGAGVLIIQSERMVEKYSSNVYAKLYMPGLSNDAYDITNPAPDGIGAEIAMSKALEHVQGSIHAVNAHATSTPNGDIIEYNAVTKKLGNVPIYAPKSKIGHTMAASGIIETIYAIESMRNKVIPHIQNLNETSIDTLGCLARVNLPMPTGVLRTLNNSFGFGGKCASQVIEV